MLHEDLTEKIIKAFYGVYNSLGYGFLEKVYERALALEFETMGLKFGRQVPAKVYHRGEVVGDYFADFVVEDKVIVEVKAIRELTDCDGKQLLNYLRVMNKDVGILLNFGKKADFKRRIFEKARKEFS